MPDNPAGSSSSNCHGSWWHTSLVFASRRAHFCCLHCPNFQPVSRRRCRSASMEDCHNITNTQSFNTIQTQRLQTHINNSCSLSLSWKTRCPFRYIPSTSPAAPWTEVWWSVCLQAFRIYNSCHRCAVAHRARAAVIQSVRSRLLVRLYKSIWYSATRSSDDKNGSVANSRLCVQLDQGLLWW